MNYALGEVQARYLKLDIGDQERLTVEDIRGLHSELVVQAFLIFSQLQSGERAKAMDGLNLLRNIDAKIDKTFVILTDLQVRKLRGVLDRLSLSVENDYRGIYGFAGSLIVVLLLFMFLLYRRVLLPLNDLQRISDLIRKGDFSARIAVNRVDEIGLLAQEFNYMAAALAESYANLERKIEERTRQLQMMQEQLVQSGKMAAVGQLVGGVAHELNNPLTVVMGYAELAQRRIAAGDADPGMQKMLGAILTHAERCSKIVANLLQFARKTEPHLEQVNINHLLEQVLGLREYELKTTNIELVRDYDANNPTLFADPQKLQQLVLNLLNNAYDAIQETDRPGQIWVRTKGDAESVTLEVLDNGTGIKEPSKVFDPFYTTKEVGKGTGLGLSVCYGIVQDHHGEIHAQNWEQGARFVVRLPIGSATAVVAPPESALRAIPSLLKITALVVDDEDEILKLQTEYLAAMGIQAHGVTSGAEAIRYLGTHTVNLIISDVRMPGIPDGAQLYDWVREFQPRLAKRFLFITGDIIGMKTDQRFQKSHVPQLQKPFHFEEFSRIIQELMES
jgi:two-component system NtrC family sensor kinase